VGRAGPLGANRCSWVVTHAHTLVSGFAAFERGSTQACAISGNQSLVGRAGPLGAKRCSWVVSNARSYDGHRLTAFEALPRLVRFPEIRAFVGRAGPLGAKRCSWVVTHSAQACAISGNQSLVGRAGPLGAKRCSWVVTHAHTLVTGSQPSRLCPGLCNFRKSEPCWQSRTLRCVYSVESSLSTK
jgi:hypothetical protein